MIESLVYKAYSYFTDDYEAENIKNDKSCPIWKVFYCKKIICFFGIDERLISQILSDSLYNVLKKEIIINKKKTY
jgi:hypothetical protein